MVLTWDRPRSANGLVRSAASLAILFIMPETTLKSSCRDKKSITNGRISVATARNRLKSVHASSESGWVSLPMQSFARELASEVDEAVRSGQESPYHEQEFTRIVLDRLADEGALENPIPLWQEGTFGRTVYKINGYSIPDDEERLVLIATVYTGELIPRVLSR